MGIPIVKIRRSHDRLIFIMEISIPGKAFFILTHWGRVTHKCVGNLTIIGSDNGLSPGRRQAIIWTNDGILLIGPLGTNFIEILVEIHIFSFKKVHLKLSSGNWRPFCLGLNVLRWGPVLRLSLQCAIQCYVIFSHVMLAGNSKF